MSKLHPPNPSVTSTSVTSTSGAPSFPATEFENRAPGDEADRGAPKPGKDPRSVTFPDASSSTSTTTTSEGSTTSTRSLRSL